MQIKQFAQMGGIRKCLAVLQFLMPIVVYAEGDTDCPRAEARGANGSYIVFQQHRFADGSSDLVLIPQNGSDMEVKRVTFGGGKTEGCLHRSVAIAPGGGDEQWGWHLAWAGEEGARYARMDGQAWVSSPPKRLSKAGASDISFQANGSELVLHWHDQHGAHQVVSHNDGRTWDQPQQVPPGN